MNLIIILSVIAIFFINLFFIDEIYKIFEPSYELDMNCNPLNDNKSIEALIIGEKNLCLEISELLKQNSIFSLTLEDSNQINMEYKYKYLIAVNKSDLDNLMICSIGIKIMGIEQVISVCNDHYNKKLYDKINVPYLYKEGLTSSELVFTLLNIYKN
ncbi:MAG: hypothetical protein PHE29_07730 [Tissierellia bacterium]|nr:hypothetical protein [Tissierellia bacterium]MDD4780177.1 hypothetical protein [Tissierellia bacterium]